MTQNVELPKVFDKGISGINTGVNWADDDDVDMEKLTASLAPLKHSDPPATNSAKPSRYTGNDHNNNNGHFSHSRNYNKEVLDDDPHFNFKFATPFSETKRGGAGNYKYDHHVSGGGSRPDGGYLSFISHNSREPYNNNNRFKNSNGFHEKHQPRSPVIQKPVSHGIVESTPQAPSKPKSNPFGNAKPVDQSKIEADIKKRLEKLSVNSTTYKLGDDVETNSTAVSKKGSSSDKEVVSDWKTRSLLKIRVEADKAKEGTSSSDQEAKQISKQKQDFQNITQTKPVKILKRDSTATPEATNAVSKVKSNNSQDSNTDVGTKAITETAQKPVTSNGVKPTKTFPKRQERRGSSSEKSSTLKRPTLSKQQSKNSRRSSKDGDETIVAKPTEAIDQATIAAADSNGAPPKRNSASRGGRRGRGNYFPNVTYTRKVETTE